MRADRRVGGKRGSKRFGDVHEREEVAFRDGDVYEGRML